MANIILRNSTGLTENLSANAVISTLPLSNIQLDNNFNNLNNTVNTKIGWSGTEDITGTITFASNTNLISPNTNAQAYNFSEKYIFLGDTPNEVTSSFVYDVKKDSDGGAWTERCQHTSWYNEELSGKWLGLVSSEAAARVLGTTNDYYQLTTDGKFYRLNAGSGSTETFRGNKREFPKLSCIVSEETSIVIYDLTESNHPMWMKFPTSGVLSNSGYLYKSAYNIYQFVEAAQGRIYGGGTLGLCEIRFLYDDILIRNSTNTLRQEYISTRTTNSTIYYSGAKINQSGSNTFVYSVSVLSPKDGIIDDYGLSIPVVGVGASYPNIIYPNEVIRYGTSPNTLTPGVALREDLFIATSGSDRGFWYLNSPTKVTSNTFTMTYKSYTNPPDWSSETTGKIVKGDNVLIKSSGNTSIAFVDMLVNNSNTVSKGIVAKISNTYNTGWLSGDIRRCYLANSTSEDRSYKRATANVTGTITGNTVSTGTELIGYSGFSANNYIREPYSADLDFGTGEWSCSAWVNVPTSLQLNTFPVVSGELLPNAGNPFIDTTGWTRFNGLGTLSVSSGKLRYDATGISGSPRISSVATTVVGKTYIATCSVSVSSGSIVVINAGGILSNTIPVGGSGVCSLAFTATSTTTTVYVYFSGAGGVFDCDYVSVKEISSLLITDRSFSVGPKINLGIIGPYLTTTVYDGTTTRYITTSAAYNSNTWVKTEATYSSNGALSLLVNGIGVASNTGSPLLSANNANAVFTIGNSYALDAPFPGSIALVKVSGTVPTSEQSTFMYEQEKHLFSSNTNCLLPENTTITDLSYNPDLNVWSATQDTKSSVWSNLIRTKTFDLGVVGNNDTTIIMSEAVNVLPELSSQSNFIKSNKDIVIFDYQGTSNQVNFSLPFGYTKSSVTKGGRKMREGATKDYITTFDGFIETVQFGVAPNTWIQIQATKR